MSKSSIVVELTPDEARLLRAQQKIIDQQVKMATGYKKVKDEGKKAGDETEKVGQQGQKSFGGQALAGLAKFAAGFISVQSSVNVVTQALVKMNQAREEASQRLETNHDSIASLREVAGTQGEFEKLVSETEKLYATGGFGSKGEAAQLVFALQSSGSLEDRELFGYLAEKNLGGDPAELARSTAAIKSTMGEEETGNSRQLVSKALAASSFSSQTTAGGLLKAAAKSGGSAKALGLSDEELLAATALVATGSSEEQGGTQVASLLKNLDKRGEFKGKSLGETIDEIEGRQLSGEDLQKLLGDQEAVQAYRALAGNRQTFDEITQSVQAGGTTRDYVSEKGGFGTEATDAEEQRRRDQVYLETVEDEDAATTAELESRTNRQRVAAQKAGPLQRLAFEARTQQTDLLRIASGDQFALGFEQGLFPREDDAQMRSRRQVPDESASVLQRAALDIQQAAENLETTSLSSAQRRQAAGVHSA